MIKIRFQHFNHHLSPMPNHLKTRSEFRLYTLSTLLTSSLTQWPPELTHNVLIYLDSDDVAMMACLGNSFQAEAERLLSQRRANWEKLPNNHMCRVEADPITKDSGQGRLQELIFWSSDEDTPDTLVTNHLCEGLFVLTSLKHLTIRLPGEPEFDVLETINSTLAYAPPWLPILLMTHLLIFFRRCTFSLKKLHLSEYFELFPWILNQTELEIIAVYTPNHFWGFNSNKHLSCQRWLSSSPCFRNPPTFFIFSPDGQKKMDRISAFLTFSPGWSAKLICYSLKRFYTMPDNVNKFGLYVQTMDELDDENILSVIRSISDHFPYICTLTLFVGDCMIHLVRPPSILSLW